jgi:hypothetical protein
MTGCRDGHASRRAANRIFGWHVLRQFPKPSLLNIFERRDMARFRSKMRESGFVKVNSLVNVDLLINVRDTGVLRCEPCRTQATIKLFHQRDYHDGNMYFVELWSQWLTDQFELAVDEQTSLPTLRLSNQYDYGRNELPCFSNSSLNVRSFLTQWGIGWGRYVVLLNSPKACWWSWGLVNHPRIVELANRSVPQWTGKKANWSQGVCAEKCVRPLEKSINEARRIWQN